MSDNSTLQVFETIFTGVLALTSIALTVATALYVKATNRYVKVSEKLLKVNEQLVELNKSQSELAEDKLIYDFYSTKGLLSNNIIPKLQERAYQVVNKYLQKHNQAT